MKARQVLKILISNGYSVVRSNGSHKILSKPGTNTMFPFCFHNSEEIGPKMRSKIQKDTGVNLK